MKSLHQRQAIIAWIIISNQSLLQNSGILELLVCCDADRIDTCESQRLKDAFEIFEG